MIGRKALDLSSYLIVGPENTKGRLVPDIVREALGAGFTCVQVRSKTATAREMLALVRACADVRAELGLAERVALLIDDRLDLVLAARVLGVAVDGVHVGQTDVPPEICRKLLGSDAIVGLSAPREELLRYIRAGDLSCVDYLGAGPLRPTASKPDAGLLADGTRHLRTMDELQTLAQASPVPIVVGGGVTEDDLPAIRATGAAGFFVISAVAGVDDPARAAQELVTTWKKAAAPSR